MKEDKKDEGGKGDHSKKVKGEEYLSKSEKNSEIR
jgi:hypothetical protein